MNSFFNLKDTFKKKQLPKPKVCFDQKKKKTSKKVTTWDGSEDAQ